MIRFLSRLICGLLIVWVALYLASRKTFPVEYGVSFSDVYAEEIGLDPKVVYGQIMTDLKPKYVRLAAYWKFIEKKPGEYDFSSLDYFMEESEKHGVRVVLVVGQKAPRWPECFHPDWFLPHDPSAKEGLFRYVETVVTRYKEHPALEFWQVENEAFIRFPFGECSKFQEQWVEEEVAKVRALDTTHPIIMTDSGEMGFWKKAAGVGDYFGTTLYRVVRLPGGMRWGYFWIPSATYRLKAWVMGVQAPEKFFVSELQAEPWFDAGGPNSTELSRQYETMDRKRFEDHLGVAERTGASRAYLWGVEWWYWLKEKHGDASMWELGKEVLHETNKQ